MAPASITLTAPATPAGVDELQSELDELKRQWGSEAVSTTTEGAMPSADEHDAVKLYKRTRIHSRSRELLEILPGGRANGLTPTELAELMRLDRNGEKLSRGSVRAAIRVVQRVTTKALKQGAISDDVLQIDFSGYDEDNAGRYYVEEDARKALDAFLASK